MMPWQARLTLLGVLAGGIVLGFSRNQVNVWLVEQKCGRVRATQVEREKRECLERHLTDVVLLSGPQRMLDETAALLAHGMIDIPTCHWLLHKTGPVVIEASMVLSQAFSVKNGGLCAAGYYHGVVERALSQGSRVPETLCQDIGEQYGDRVDINIVEVNCYHGLGHALMASTNYDLLGSLAVCDRVAVSVSFFCVDGIFMENFSMFTGNFSPPHGSTQWVKADDPFYPCNTIDTKYREACYLYTAPPLLTSVDQSFQAALSRCGELGIPDKKYCSQGIGLRLGYIIANEGFSPVAARDVCLMPENRFPAACVSNVARTIVSQEEDLASVDRFCRVVPLPFEDTCVVDTVRVGKMFPGIPARELRAFCNQSSLEIRENCLQLISK